ncbi:MAG: cyclic nucleotide-binding domain-containing protein [Acidobacteriota bacterium]
MDHRPEIDQLLNLAASLRRDDLPEEAGELLRVVLRLDPTHVGAKVALAEVRRSQRQADPKGRPPSLREQLREQLRRHAIDAAQFRGLAEIYLENNQRQRAEQCLEVARARDLASPGLHKLHGRLLFEGRDFAVAAEELGHSLRLDPFDGDAAELLGRAEYGCHELEKALEATIQAFLLTPRNSDKKSERLRRRIQTLRKVLEWDNRQLSQAFQARRAHLQIAFDRLEWRRERFLEEHGLEAEDLAPQRPTPPPTTGSRLALAGRLRRIPMLEHLGDDQIFELSAACRSEEVEAGTSLFHHGSYGRDIFWLEQGEIQIRRETSYGTFRLGTLQTGDLLGEAGYITGLERSGTAYAVTAATLMRLDADTLDLVIERHPELGVQLHWTFWHGLSRKLRATNGQLQSFFDPGALPENFLRLRRQDVVGARQVKVDPNAKIRLFREQGLSRRELMTLATFSRERSYPQGSFIFREGDEGQEMHIVLDGQVMISKFIAGGGDEGLAILGRGEFFGEMSLIDGEPRSADARPHGGSATVLTLDQSAVQEILSYDSPAALEFLQLLCRLIAHRLREIDEKVIGWRILSGDRSESVSA